MDKFWGLATYDCGPGGVVRFWRNKPTLAQLMNHPVHGADYLPESVARELIETGRAYDGVDWELEEIEFEGG